MSACLIKIFLLTCVIITVEVRWTGNIGYDGSFYPINKKKMLEKFLAIKCKTKYTMLK